MINLNVNLLGPDFKTWYGKYSWSPDKVLGNNKIYHNHVIEKCSPCSNDHIPMLITIATNPIKIPVIITSNFF